MNKDHQSAPNSDLGQALGQAMQSEANRSRSSKHDSNLTSSTAVAVRNMWQHPFVDIFKHFKLMPVQDWKQNKRQGDVSEFFAKEIGRKAIDLSGTISANNFVQIPHPSSITNTLGLTGRYLYLQVKAPLSSSPFSFHIDLQMAERSHGIRISSSNLYKKVTTQNGFVMQVPLNLDINRWTVVVYDMYELLKHSRLLPASYLIEGSYQIKGLTLCANSNVRGVYTSDNLYDFVTLPPDMRFKFQFEIQRWPEYFAWLELPQDLDDHKNEKKLAVDRIEQARAKAALRAQHDGQHLTNDQQRKMQMEIDGLLTHQKQQTSGKGHEFEEIDKQARYEAMQAEMQAMLGSKSGHGGDDLLSPDEKLGFHDISEKRYDVMGRDSRGGFPQGSAYHGGQFVGSEIKRSQKLNQDPIMELKHIIGYSPSSCLNLKWSRLPHENVVIFSSAGVLITMDVENNQQKRFFFGHSSPICCFDIASHGNIIASAQEGKNSIIRIWDYHTARCLSMLPMPVVTMKCVSFSPDGRYLASVGKDAHNKELIVVWDISKIHRNEKPEILARQTSDFNILCLKFSPIDNFRLVSCGKENIRFWRIKETANIRGSAVVLNQHARNTVFTCLDFEHGARAAISAHSSFSKENEALKRVYVASKHGMVFQINYATEQLEATYKTNDSAIFTIAVNEAFCVTGSQDNYLRVWPLDFSEFVMEAKHEGTVCSVDISADGLRVVCGTLYGSLGVLDKSNQRYRTLIRSHTDQILSMDFHLALRNIITVSLDGTIRLWDLQNFDQVIEFNSPLEQPLCVAAHPTLPLFSCGFQTGTMRVFDIEKTCVASEFTQFNKPIKALAYSASGDLLVTCCEDGSVAVHNARRQHLPTKMLHLEFPPQFVHVAFSPVIVRQKMTFKGGLDMDMDDQSSRIDHQSQSQEGGESQRLSDGMDPLDQNEVQTYYESLFAVMGEYGNCITIYSSDSIIIKHQIQVGTVIRSFQFHKNGREIIVLTKDQRIRFYSLARFEGVYLRELCTVHRGAVRCSDLSNNGGFMLTGGEDNLLKIWDYDAQKTTPTHFQAFIGHTYPVFNAMFNPFDNNMVFSAGENDGIFIWQFHGDTETNYHPQLEEEEIHQHQTAMSMQIDRDALNEPSVLEKMRAKVQEKRKPKLAEFSFLFKEFKPISTTSILKLPGERIQDVYEQFYNKKRREEEITLNHFVSLKDQCNIEIKLDAKTHNQLGDECKIMEPFIVNGYDGFSGVHDNLIWNPMSGSIIYTLNNKVIIEQTKTRDQIVFSLSTVRLSCLAQSVNGKYLAAAEGEPNEQGQCFIYLIDLVDKKLKKTLVFHQKGIQSIAFGFRDKVLISVGVKDSHVLVMHSVEYGNSIRPTNCRTHSTNKIIVKTDDEDDGVLRWITVGTQGSLIMWQVSFEGLDVDEEIRDDFPNTEVLFRVMQVPNEEIEHTNFLTAAFSKDALIIGCADGAVCAFNTREDHEAFHDDGRKAQVTLPNQQITQVSVKTGQVLLTTSSGTLINYSIVSGAIFPPEDQEKINFTALNAGSITAVSMDDKNEEGMVGTSQGKIFYVCLKDAKDKQKEKVQVQLVQKVSPSLENCDIVRFDPGNPRVFMTNTGDERGEVKLFSSLTMDTIFTFQEYQLGPVRFITSQRSAGLRMLGYANGLIRFVSLTDLDDYQVYQIKLEYGEELTCGCYSANNQNWAIGTSYGSVIFGATDRDLFRTAKGYTAQRIDGLMKSQDYGVTSIQLSHFTPDGSLMCAFDNGEVKLWKCFIPEDRRLKLKKQMDDEKQGSRNRKKKNRALDIADIGISKFDIFDSFDMFSNPHSMTHQTESDIDETKDIYGGKRYSDCAAMFDPTGTHNEKYFCFVSALQYIFVRNFAQHTVIKKIPLMHFPTTMSLLDCGRFRSEAQLQTSALDTMICVGTKEAQVLVYVYTQAEEAKNIVRTRAGTMYGEVRGLSVQEDGNLMVCSSSSGEITSFNLIKALEI